MSAAFTPGPWAVEREPYIHIRAKDGSQNGWGGTVYAGDYPPSDSDARLIAAAPELYESCEAALEWLEANGHALGLRAHLRGSLRKARGEQ